MRVFLENWEIMAKCRENIYVAKTAK
jgi:hypothetical protein